LKQNRKSFLYIVIDDYNFSFNDCTLYVGMIMGWDSVYLLSTSREGSWPIFLGRKNNIFKIYIFNYCRSL